MLNSLTWKMSNKYNIFLKELADHLTRNDVETIKFLMGSNLPAGKAEDINNAMQLLSAMDMAKVISCTDLSLLRTMFNHIPRRDLITKLDKYKEIVIIEPPKEIKIAEEKSEDCVDLGPTENIDNSDDQVSPTTCPSENFQRNHIHNQPLPAISIPWSTAIPAYKRAGSTGAQLTRPLGSFASSPTETVQLMTPDYFRKKRADSKSPNSDRAENSELKFPSNISRQSSSHNVRPDEYSMVQSPHGDCIIFSNRFDEPVKLDENTVLNQRFGTEKDVVSLTKTFEYLNFRVETYRNQSASEIVMTLKYYAENKEQDKNDCIVVCMLSHGYEGGIYGNYGAKLSSKVLKSIFTGNNCPRLLTKPKLFFIQACQGDDDGKGVRLEPDAPSAPIVQDHLQDHLGEGGPAFSGTGVYEEIISTDADFLFFMATTPGTISWRDPVKGSWFVQTLCEVFRKHAESWSLMDILLTVNNEIALKKEDVGDGLAKQMSNLSKNTLRKQLYFFPETNGIRRNTEGKIPNIALEL